METRRSIFSAFIKTYFLPSAHISESLPISEHVAEALRQYDHKKDSDQSLMNLSFVLGLAVETTLQQVRAVSRKNPKDLLPEETQAVNMFHASQILFSELLPNITPVELALLYRHAFPGTREWASNVHDISRLHSARELYYERYPQAEVFPKDWNIEGANGIFLPRPFASRFHAFRGFSLIDSNIFSAVRHFAAASETSNDPQRKAWYAELGAYTTRFLIGRSRSPQQDFPALAVAQQLYQRSGNELAALQTQLWMERVQNFPEISNGNAASNRRTI